MSYTHKRDIVLSLIGIAISAAATDLLAGLFSFCWFVTEVQRAYNR